MASAILLAFRGHGIYAIRNTVNNKLYVGSSVNIWARMYKHQARLRRGDQPNGHLQAAWNRYGEDAFRSEILEKCSATDLLKVEQRYIDTLAPEYNICQFAANTAGYRHTMASRKLMSEQRRGNTFALGHRHTPETRARLSALAKERPPKGEEERRAISERMRGNTNTRGYVPSQGTKTLLSQASLKMWADPEFRATMAAKHKARWAAKKAAQS